MPVAFTMPRNQRPDVLKSKNTVGPGQYNPKKEQDHTSPTYKIGSEIRGKKQDEHNPGPGNYDPKNPDNKPSYTLSKKFEQINNSIAYNPGPGAYENNYVVDAKARTPSYSLRKRNEISVKNFNPAPDAYHPSYTQTRHKSERYTLRGGSVGKRGNPDLRNVPGPGTYTVEKGAGFENKANIFGTELQRIQEKSTANATPGPGNYDSAIWFNNENLRFSKTMGVKVELTTLNEAKKTPPPGTYDPDRGLTNVRVPSYSLPKQIRGKMKLENTPAPNAYKVRKDISADSPYWSIGNEQRKGLQDRRNNPGPGTYDTDLNAGERAQKYSMPGKNEGTDKEGLAKPGPGTYNPHEDLTKQYAPKFLFGTGTRRDLAGKNINPGPGNYEDKTTLKKGGAKFYTGTRSDQMKNINPGPGNYENKTGIEESLEKTRGCSMGIRYDPVKKDKVVGPGAYQPSYSTAKKNASTIKIGSEERGKFRPEQNPGPGAYDSKGTNEASQWGFGSNPRHTIPVMKGVPGPGTYKEDQYAIKTAMPAYGFGLRPEIIDKDNLAKPGPGSYNPSKELTNQKEPAFKIGTGKRTTMGNKAHVPGPGNYDPKSDLNKRAAGIGYGKKETLCVKSFGPGPGQYEIDRNINPLPPFERTGKAVGQLVSVSH